ncbi:MAG: signal recognition particle-docking protein FtsY [Candidatus Cloacimonadaceae bacterium]|nr:signal recognition particle-docking protein FtsY [Candidatus Cloacimonadaceae bacterium]
MLSIVRNLKEKMAKTKSGFLGKIADAIMQRDVIDEELFEEIETILLKSDTGVEMSALIIEELKQRIDDEKIVRIADVHETLQVIMKTILLQDLPEQHRFFEERNGKPRIIVFVGVNGVGKTTSIGKVANRLCQKGKTVLIVAGDTFRAAAIEQLGIWAERASCNIIRSQHGADPASVIYDGISSAIAREYDYVLIDTAGRQHTKENLMKELSKIDRTIKKLIPSAPHEVLLVIDSTTGQNAISQARHFHDVIRLSGIILTKYDGTAKGGIIFNLKLNLSLPVKLIGIGEGINDLEEFSYQDFIEAFFSEDGKEKENE